MRSDRLLRGMHQVCSHDLPNQLVVLQSLLEMLQLEEASRLSPDGLEYVHRLKTATQRTTELGRFLKEMEKLARYIGKPDEISLPALARELEGALADQLPHKEWTFAWQWDVASVGADGRTLLQALVEILTWSAGRQGNACQVRGASGIEKKGIGLRFELRTADAPGNNLPKPTASPGIELAPERRIEIVLARECLAISQATLEWPPQVGGGDRFIILVPNP